MDFFKRIMIMMTVGRVALADELEHRTPRGYRARAKIRGARRERDTYTQYGADVAFIQPMR